LKPIALALMIATRFHFSYILAVSALRCDSFDGSLLYNTLVNALGPFVNAFVTQYYVVHVLPANTAIDFRDGIMQSFVAS
jgi:hypothetical protein